MLSKPKTSSYHFKKRKNLFRKRLRLRRKRENYRKLLTMNKENFDKMDKIQRLAYFAKISIPIDHSLKRRYRSKVIDEKYINVWETPNSYTQFHAHGSGQYVQWFLYHDRKGRRYEINISSTFNLTDSSKDQIRTQACEIHYIYEEL